METSSLGGRFFLLEKLNCFYQVVRSCDREWNIFVWMTIFCLGDYEFGYFITKIFFKLTNLLSFWKK